jgi:hypothetical protein
MRVTTRLAIPLLAAAGTIWLSGCTIGGEPDEPPPPPQVIYPQPAPTAYVVEPGYYYVPEYYDVHHYHHPRAYYYYDGRRYIHRDSVPRGYVAREFHGYPHNGRGDYHHDRH